MRVSLRTSLRGGWGGVCTPKNTSSSLRGKLSPVTAEDKDDWVSGPGQVGAQLGYRHSFGVGGGGGRSHAHAHSITVRVGHQRYFPCLVVDYVMGLMISTAAGVSIHTARRRAAESTTPRGRSRVSTVDVFA